VRRLGIILIITFACWLPGSAVAASTSHVALWTALGGNLSCGPAIHEPGKPVSQIICSDIHIPPPKSQGPADGDPGFVFLASSGRPVPARTSQDTFAGTGNPVSLPAGTTWRISAVNVTCVISAQSVRCQNGAHHGFTITKRAYTSF
jgi:hypothetical protein